jgi:hypothetical protein
LDSQEEAPPERIKGRRFLRENLGLGEKSLIVIAPHVAWVNGMRRSGGDRRVGTVCCGVSAVESLAHKLACGRSKVVAGGGLACRCRRWTTGFRP